MARLAKVCRPKAKPHSESATKTALPQVILRVGFVLALHIFDLRAVIAYKIIQRGFFRCGVATCAPPAEVRPLALEADVVGERIQRVREGLAKIRRVWID